MHMQYVSTYIINILNKISIDLFFKSILCTRQVLLNTEQFI